MCSCALPVTPWSRVSRPALVTQQLSPFAQVAGGAEAVEVTIQSSLELSHRGERVEEEEGEKETTEASQGHYLSHRRSSHTTHTLKQVPLPSLFNPHIKAVKHTQTH